MKSIKKRRSIEWLQQKHTALLQLVTQEHVGHWVQTFYPKNSDVINFRCACGIDLQVTEKQISAAGSFQKWDIQDLVKHVGVDVTGTNQQLIVQCSVLWDELTSTIGQLTIASGDTNESTKKRIEEAENRIRTKVVSIINQKQKDNDNG